VLQLLLLNTCDLLLLSLLTFAGAASLGRALAGLRGGQHAQADSHVSATGAGGGGASSGQEVDQTAAGQSGGAAALAAPAAV